LRKPNKSSTDAIRLSKPRWTIRLKTSKKSVKITRRASKCKVFIK